MDFRLNLLVFSQVSEGEFDWTDTEKGLILSSSAWFFGFAKLFGGILCQKYGGKSVFGFSTLAIGILSILMPLATQFGVWAIAAVRVLQGLSGVSINSMIIHLKSDIYTYHLNCDYLNRQQGNTRKCQLTKVSFLLYVRMVLISKIFGF